MVHSGSVVGFKKKNVFLVFFKDSAHCTSFSYCYYLCKKTLVYDYLPHCLTLKKILYFMFTFPKSLPHSLLKIIFISFELFSRLASVVCKVEVFILEISIKTTYSELCGVFVLFSSDSCTFTKDYFVQKDFDICVLGLLAFLCVCSCVCFFVCLCVRFGLTLM